MLRCIVLCPFTDARGKSKGCGFVRFAFQHEAHAAIAALHNQRVVIALPMQGACARACVCGCGCGYGDNRVRLTARLRSLCAGNDVQVSRKLLLSLADRAADSDQGGAGGGRGQGGGHRGGGRGQPRRGRA